MDATAKFKRKAAEESDEQYCITDAVIDSTTLRTKSNKNCTAVDGSESADVAMKKDRKRKKKQIGATRKKKSDKNFCDVSCVQSTDPDIGIVKPKTKKIRKLKIVAENNVSVTQ